MTDAASPTSTRRGAPRGSTDGGEGETLGRTRWISVEIPARAALPSRSATATAVLLVVAVAAALRLYRIGAQPLWVDEATSLHLARESLSQLWSWSTIADPGNPPLYYSLLHGWVALGDSEARLRLLSSLFGVGTIPLVYALGRTIHGHRLGILSAFLFAISPFQVWYSQEARGYALLTFGATSAMLGVAFLLRHPERSGHTPLRATRPDRAAPEGSVTPEVLATSGAGWAWLAYVLGTTVALLAHDTAVFLPIGANVLVVGSWWFRGRGPRGSLRNWLLAQLAVLVLWGSWLPAYLQQVLHGDAYAWIPHPSVGGVLSGAYDVYGGVTRSTPYAIEALVVLILAILGLWSWRHDRRWIAFALTFGLVAPIGELIVSVWRPIFLTQTLIWAAVPLQVTVAAGLLSLRPRAVAATVLVVLVAMAGLGLRSYYFLYDKEAWDQVAAYVDHRLQRGDAIVFSASFLQIPFDYYHVPPRSYSVGETGLQGTSGDVPVTLADAADHRRIWLVVSHARPNTDSVISALGGIDHLIGVVQFTDVDVYLYGYGEG